MDLQSIGEIVGITASSSVGLVLAFQQIYRRFKSTNSNIKVDTEVSGSTIEIIRLLREQNTAAAAAAAAASEQYEKLISANAARYNELLETNNVLYSTINDLQVKINDLNSKIGGYQLDNQKLQNEIVTLRENNSNLAEQVTKLTSEVHKLRRGVA